MTAAMTGGVTKGDLETAHALADAAAKITLKHFRTAVGVTNKDAGGFDPVTVADQGAETAMRKLIARRHRDDGIIGEEFAAVAGRAGRDWILDPIDGTKAFILGYPMWGTLIGLVVDGTPALGLMDQPYTRERFWAIAAAHRGKGAFVVREGGRARRMTTRSGVRLADAVLTATAPDMFKTAHQRAAFAALSGRARLTRFGGDCYMYVMLAAGHVDLVVEAGLKAVDIAPLIPIIEAAGGVVTTWTGGPATAGGDVVAAGDATLHAAALKILSNTRTDVLTA
jgi:myo-inositol-1(or 4)-monophosphatase